MLRPDAPSNRQGLTARGAMRNDVRITVRIATNLSLPKDLVDELDAIAGKRNRSAYVEEVLRERLRRERAKRAWLAAAGTLKAADYPHWATSELVQKWVRDRRAEETDPGPEDGGDVRDAGLDDRDRLPARSG